MERTCFNANITLSKNLTGPALISPSLTFQAWFKAQFGHQAWESLDKIPRLQWDEYLKWFKK